MFISLQALEASYTDKKAIQNVMQCLFNNDMLQELQSAGLTHVHLLPSYDFGSVPEKLSDQKLPEVS